MTVLFEGFDLFPHSFFGRFHFMLMDTRQARTAIMSLIFAGPCCFNVLGGRVSDVGDFL